MFLKMNEKKKGIPVHWTQQNPLSDIQESGGRYFIMSRTRGLQVTTSHLDAGFFLLSFNVSFPKISFYGTHIVL